MAVEIRPIRDDELPAFIDAQSAPFLERPDSAKVAEEVRGLWELSRCWAAVEGDHIVGTLRTFAASVTVPAAVQLPATAVTSVGVLPTHRRRGILRSLMAAEHAAARIETKPSDCCTPPSTRSTAASGTGRRPAPPRGRSTRGQPGFRTPATGRVELITPSPAARDRVRDVFKRWHGCQVGEIGRRDYSWDFSLGLREQAWGTKWKGFLALHTDDSGALDGYVRYRTEAKWEHNVPRGTATVDDLIALTPEAYAALWQYLASMDLVVTVKAEGRSPSERLPWLLADARAANQADAGDAMWLRLLDVPVALGARVYERQVDVVLEVVDPEAPSGRIRVRLQGGPDGAAVRPTSDPPDLTLDVAALGAAYLGGSRLRDAVLASGFDEHRRGSLAEADAAFRTADEPWCATFF